MSADVDWAAVEADYADANVDGQGRFRREAGRLAEAAREERGRQRRRREVEAERQARDHAAKVERARELREAADAAEAELEGGPAD